MGEAAGLELVEELDSDSEDDDDVAVYMPPAQKSSKPASAKQKVLTGEPYREIRHNAVVWNSQAHKPCQEIRENLQLHSHLQECT